MTEKLEKLTAEDGKSLDLETQNIEKLKQLFPDVFREGKVDFEALKAALGDHVEDKEERYNFTWHGKNKARQIAQTPSTGTLRPCKEESVNWDTTENLFIEGDNLEVLKLLQKSYHQKVKMIYIDPPYNTGKDFVYKDNFQDNIKNYKKITNQVDSEGVTKSNNPETSGRYHSDWLNMIYPRLKLARNLLRNDGVIFISIGNDEIVNLKKLCDEIYGEDNFIESISWNKRIPKNDKGVGNIHEYILIYAKDASLKHELLMRKDGLDDIYNLSDKLKKSKTPIVESEKEIKKLYKKNGYDRGITLYNSLDSNYRLWGKINMSWPNANTFGPDYKVYHPMTGNPVKMPDRGWRWKLETFEDAAGIVNNEYADIEKLHDGSILCNKIWFAKDENTQPSSVTYLDDVNTFLLRSVLSLKSDGGIEVEKLFDGKSFFSYPKPTSLLKTLISSISRNEDDVILDFFAGSGTTAHSVFNLNAEENKNRKFIMVQLPEELDKSSEAKKAGYNNIAELSRDRIRRAGEGIQTENSSSKVDVGFKTFKLDISNIKQWEPSFDNLSDILDNSVDSIKPERTSEDVLYEILLKYGLDLTYPITEHILAGKTVYDVAFGSLIVCLDEGITRETVEAIGKLKQELDSETTRVVFKDAGFADDAVKVNAIQLLKQYGVDDVKSI